MKRTAQSGFGDASIGGEVFTSDGKRLGKVWDVQNASFQVDCSYELEYWLPFNTVESADAERITLTFPKAALNRFKSREPLVA